MRVVFFSTARLLMPMERAIAPFDLPAAIRPSVSASRGESPAMAPPPLPRPSTTMLATMDGSIATPPLVTVSMVSIMVAGSAMRSFSM